MVVLRAFCDSERDARGVGGLFKNGNFSVK